MQNMPFKSDQQPFYSDENENVIFRVKDIKKLLEEYVKLPLIECRSMGTDSDPSRLQELYPDLMPDRIWFVWAIFQAPEGKKTSEVFLMLKDGKLSFPRGVFLHLETFLVSHRRQVKQDSSDSTRDYIETLEEIASNSWRFWAILCIF